MSDEIKIREDYFSSMKDKRDKKIKRSLLALNLYTRLGSSVTWEGV